MPELLSSTELIRFAFGFYSITTIPNLLDDWIWGPQNNVGMFVVLFGIVELGSLN